MTLEEFFQDYKECNIVNYDVKPGYLWRKSSGELEIFKKDENGNYIEYPYIQPYLKLNGNSNISLFIIKNKTLFKLKAGDGNTYKIAFKLEGIDTSIFDDLFKDTQSANKPYPKKEDIYIIEE